jgi:hypothetical protein
MIFSQSWPETQDKYTQRSSRIRRFRDVGGQIPMSWDELTPVLVDPLVDPLDKNPWWPALVHFNYPYLILDHTT